MRNAHCLLHLPGVASVSPRRCSPFFSYTNIRSQKRCQRWIFIVITTLQHFRTSFCFRFKIKIAFIVLNFRACLSECICGNHTCMCSNHFYSSAPGRQVTCTLSFPLTAVSTTATSPGPIPLPCISPPLWVKTLLELLQIHQRCLSLTSNCPTRL